MVLHPAEFELRSTDDAARVRARIAEVFRVRPRRAPDESKLYLDTFDWRLRRAGAVLAFNGTKGRHTLTLTGDAARATRAEVAGTPGFASELPDGELRRAIAPVVEARRLFPVAQVRTHATALDVLDEREKTVARVRLEQRSACSPDGNEWRPTAAVVRLTPVRGYDREFTELARFLVADVGLRERDESELDDALSAVGTRDTDPDGPVEVSPHEGAAAVTRRALRREARAMDANLDGLLRDLDTEFLHEFRVALRRTRAVLRELRRAFPAPAVEHYRGELKWVGDLTGPSRDLDVWTLELPKYVELLDADAVEALAPLRAAAAVRRAAERARMVDGLRSDRWRNLRANWREFLENGASGGAFRPEASEPASEAVTARVQKRWQRVLDGGRDLRAESPPKELHALRIQCKRLRYLLDVFQSLWGAERTGEAVRVLKRLQSVLGDYNDLAVHERMVSELARDASVDADGALAAGRLAERLRVQRAEKRAAFEQRFHTFAKEKSRRVFAELLEGGA